MHMQAQKRIKPPPASPTAHGARAPPPGPRSSKSHLGEIEAVESAAVARAAAACAAETAMAETAETAETAERAVAAAAAAAARCRVGQCLNGRQTGSCGLAHERLAVHQRGRPAQQASTARVPSPIQWPVVVCQSWRWPVVQQPEIA